MRRTSTIDMWWPDGWGTPMQVRARARDLLTPVGGADPSVLADDVVQAVVAPDRTIEQISSEPPRDLTGLVGARGGSKLRSAIADTVPDEGRRGTPLHLLLDDLAGATLVGGFAFTQWPEHWPAHWGNDRTLAFRGRRMAGVCIGFGPGSSALTDAGEARPVDNTRPVAPLVDPDDPAGWHELFEVGGVTMRRARRADVWQGADGLVQIDAMFQDSSSAPAGERIAVHEYQIHAAARADTFELVSVEAVPRVLPFDECPSAVTRIAQLVGIPIGTLRHEVLSRLRTTKGCTHLNDELRSLAEVPVLAAHL